MAAILAAAGVTPVSANESSGRLRPTAQETVLYSFGGGADGAGSGSGVIADASGTLYGTTVFGGPASNGDIFALTPGQTGWTEKVLYTFSGGSDGARPLGGLVADVKGNLYGTTFGGGDAGVGVVFKLKPTRSGYKESVLYTFSGRSDGGSPVGNLVRRKNGTLIGVATEGGACDLCGTVFALTPSGSGYVESTLYSFVGAGDGYLPEAGITADKQGSIYGTTQWGGGGGGCGGGGCGTVFKLVYSNGTYTENTLHVFHGGGDGANPAGALTVDSKTGIVFGTTQYGGANGANGIVFTLTPAGGAYNETILHSFDGFDDGFGPMGQLLLHQKRLYGTTTGGGPTNYGTIYELKPSQTGYAFKSLYNFAGPPDGSDPEFTSLIMDANGALYGTTRSGGSKTQQCGGIGPTDGCGTVFELTH
jgi:uncharacterized repeat protein (TIGR03803 family)